MDFFKPYFAYLFSILFFVYAAASLFWYFNSEAVYLLIKWFILLQAFVLGHYLKSLKQLFEGLALGIGVSSILVLFGVKGGLFINPNTLAETGALILVGTLVYKSYWYIPCLLPSVFTGSRAALLGLGLTFSWWIWSKSKLLSVLVASIGLVFFTYRFETIQDRLNIWQYVLENTTWFGHGLSTFRLDGYYNLVSRPIFAHNDLLQILHELGIVGAILISGFFLCVLRIEKDERYILFAFIVVSMFTFPLYLPVSACIAFLVCGYLCSNKRLVCNTVGNG